MAYKPILVYTLLIKPPPLQMNAKQVAYKIPHVLQLFSDPLRPPVPSGRKTQQLAMLEMVLLMYNVSSSHQLPSMENSTGSLNMELPTLNLVL